MLCIERSRIFTDYLAEWKGLKKIFAVKREIEKEGKKTQGNMNILRKIGVGIHKNYLKEKKQTVKSNMFNCLLNDGYLLEILQNCAIL